ncbi:uncharacterized protein B0H64DRAFT_475687 [Chaetomium fimeti]|uniref:WD-like domain-containing protein n=1 Tax=Chaetomium fimeti TaxID=1854472 RepID=A0AAE0LQJ8_9PEZI|nr:hypothetical protein B0H64DRAFT_475687 [Chaetomium fimeti]
MKYLTAITTLFAAGAIGTAIPAARSGGSAGYHLNLTLVTEGKDQYWLLTDDNLPAGLPATPGTLTSRSSHPGLQARDTPECSGNHQAPTGDCYNLLAALSNDLNEIPESPRNIRYTNCYASWSRAASGVRAELYNAGADIYNTCNSNGRVSGLKRNVNIQGTTLTQCLSDRPNGCS